MSRKTWGTLNEETLLRAVAAINFLRAYQDEQWSGRGVRIAHGKLSKYAVELQVLQRCPSAGSFETEYTGFCLGNAQWGALFWPLCLLEEGEFKGYYLNPAGEATFEHILKPQDWRVVSTKATLVGDRIFLVPTETVPLLIFFFGSISHQNSLTVADLLLLGEVMNLDQEEFNNKKLLRTQMVHALLDRISSDPAWIDEVKAAMKKPVKEKLIGDSLDEFVLAEMPLQDQKDFKEVADEIETKKKAGWSLVDQKQIPC